MSLMLTAMHNADRSLNVVRHATVLHGSWNVMDICLLLDCSSCPMTQLMEIWMLEKEITNQINIYFTFWWIQLFVWIFPGIWREIKTTCLYNFHRFSIPKKNNVEYLQDEDVMPWCGFMNDVNLVPWWYGVINRSLWYLYAGSVAVGCVAAAKPWKSNLYA